jgi:endoglucanase
MKIRINMKTRLNILLCLLSFFGASMAQTTTKFIIVDQFGYLPESQKIAVIKDPQVGFDASESFTPGQHYVVVNAVTGEQKYSGNPVVWNSGATDASSGDKAWHFDFSSVTETGRYFVLDVDKNLRSFEFEISPIVYNEVLKHAVRNFFYQRVGFPKEAQYAGSAWADGASHIGPLQDKNCRLFSDKTNPATELDLSGGWYDAGDLNKYTTWTANYVVEMMKAYLENPDAWGDNYNIPESGNGIPDLLDEAKWGIDFLLRMQQADGSVLCIVSESHASPPSSATGQSLYGPATTSASLNTAAAFAISSKVYRAMNMIAYADTLLARAGKAWDWADINPAVKFNNNSAENSSLGVGAGNQEEDDYTRSMSKLEAACFLFDATNDLTYRNYFDTVYTNAHLIVWNYAYPYEPAVQDLLLYYTRIGNASASVSDQIRNCYKNAMVNNADNFPAYYNSKDPYRAHMAAYTWGSNAQKGAQGNMYYNMNYFNLDPARNQDARNAALGYIHYIHGVNPLNIVYLSNMYQYGGDNCVNEFYHTWFCNGSAKWDRVGTSLYGPAPGYLTGGPNPGYNWASCCPSGCGSADNNAVCLSESISPPKDQPKQKSYKDFNTSWPLNSWEITENSCGYQVNYLRLLSKFVDASLDCNGDSAGIAYLDACGICSGGNTGRSPETDSCQCSAFERMAVLNVSACVDYTSPSGNFVWTSSGSYNDTIPATGGCDSILTIKLTILQPSESQQVLTSCYELRSPSGKYTWTVSGVYNDTILNSRGCDSVITVNLTIPEVNIAVTQVGDTLFAEAPGATFRWLQCSENYVVINNAVEHRYTPAASGEYAVEVSQDECVDTSDCFLVNITGILFNTLGDGLEIFPNPATASITINLPEIYEKVDIELTNFLGQPVMRESFYGKKKLTLSLNEPKGLYFLTIQNNLKEMAVMKIVLE